MRNFIKGFFGSVLVLSSFLSVSFVGLSVQEAFANESFRTFNLDLRDRFLPKTE